VNGVLAYSCRTCGAKPPLSVSRWRCDCGSPLDLDFECEPVDRRALALRPTSLWRYHECLPMGDRLGAYCLGEGVSPVVDDHLGDTPVHLALEYVSPTGSYKDRGVALLVTAAVALGATEVVDDSSGNAAIALAAHAGRAGLPVKVLVPADASPTKPRLAQELGAEVVRVQGGRAGAAAAAVREAAAGAFYASHAWNPFFLHGTKTLAYSLCEALRWSPPGAILVPVGNGGLLLGLDLGLRELRRHGLIEHRPALIGVQAAACAPLALAWERGDATPVPVREEPTVADGVRVGMPPRGAEVLEVVRQGGRVVSVGEDEIEEARRALWRRGYMVESTGAVAAAYALREGPALRNRYGDLVVVLTGSGLKL
jgi:threonine synthase